MPDEGCILWSDNMVIPVGAPNPTAAYEFMNYVYDPENQAQIAAYNYYTTPVDGVQETIRPIDPVAAKSQLIFPPAKYQENCSTQPEPPRLQAGEHRAGVRGGCGRAAEPMAGLRPAAAGCPTGCCAPGLIWLFVFFVVPMFFMVVISRSMRDRSTRPSS